MRQIHSGIRDQPYSSSEALHSLIYSIHQSKVFFSQLHKNMQVNNTNIKFATIHK